MTEALKLGISDADTRSRIRRLNRLPIVVAIVLVVLFLGVIFYGLSTRGFQLGSDSTRLATGSRPASTHADQLKQGVPDGIIGDPPRIEYRPAPIETAKPAANPFTPHRKPTPVDDEQGHQLEREEAWRARLEREQEEQMLRELHRQRMASVQANDAAFDSPISVNLQHLSKTDAGGGSRPPGNEANGTRAPSALDLYASAMQAGAASQDSDPNGQSGKERFFNRDMQDLGHLPNGVVPQMSRFELKRGSVIPATLVTGINSDLPGLVSAQVSQNVYDSATGRHLLIPQGSKLFGRYDSHVSFGQDRVLAVWTDIIFPNGSTLQIGAMAGTDAAGYGGFNDRVDNHYARTFGAAILVALIGAGTETMIPRDRSSFGTANGAEDAARRSFAETFGKMSEQTISRNLNVQPTLEIRPGYRFNVMVDQDITFPGSAR
ncbi:IncP-type conjugal transfer protein TrbI [Mesorhizobium sp. CAU 1741]|uniref:IncP-type conjugal transfer protein TrbI n=1 Tax=Mesorhizobium sp. CAU 1741 TaxID=3140366 RepID=UPI00325ADD2B